MKSLYLTTAWFLFAFNLCAQNVGIGIATPLKTLHVSGTAISTGITPSGNAVIVAEKKSSPAYINILTDLDRESGIVFGNQNSAADGGIYYNTGATSYDLRFRTNGNLTRMTIDSIGHVGIGTTAPEYRLHVTTGNLGGAFADGIVVQNTNASTGEAAISFKNTGTNGTGNKLWIVGLNENRNLSFNYGTSFNGPNTKVVIDSTGNVGIGNIIPTEKLDVTGNIKASGAFNRPTTGTANLVPICYGVINHNAVITSGSGNFSVVRSALGELTITITGETYSIGAYTTIVTVIDIAPYMSVSFQNSGNLIVKTFQGNQLANNADISFVVYKP